MVHPVTTLLSFFLPSHRRHFYSSLPPLSFFSPSSSWIISFLEGGKSCLSTLTRKDRLLSIAHMIALQNRPILPPAKVDISLLLKPQDEEEAPAKPTPVYPPRAGFTIPPPVPAAPILTTAPPALVPPLIKSAPGLPAKRLQPAHTAESPAKKQSKWSPEEDALIIELRGSGMKWEDISKRLPGRSAISCRLHYQNYLERRSEWDEDKKNKLARLYER